MRTIVSAIESAGHDVRYGLRLLRRSPWFTCVGIASLAIGLGGGIALFTAMNAIVLRPLPGRGTADLHAIHTSNSGGGRYGSSSFADFRSFTSTDPRLFANTCATTNVTGNLDIGGNAQPLGGAVVSGGCFDALAVQPHLGRLISPSDDEGDGDSVAVVISYALWRRSFAEDPDVVGRGTLLNGTSVTIVGVAERGFTGVSFDAGSDFWAPPQMLSALVSPRALTARGERRFRIYVRLSDGVSAPQAVERLAAVATSFRREDPDRWTERSGVTRTITIVPELQSRFASGSGGAREILTASLGAIAAIVAITCLNLATMILARGAARRRELNVRLALGASRGRLLRQLATESLLISVGGALIGLVIAATGLRMFDVYRPPDVPAFNLALDWRVVSFAIALAILAPALFGLAPGAHALRLAIAEGLKGRPLIVRRRWLPIGSRELLLAVQIVASFALLVASGLFLRSLMARDTGLPGLSTRSLAVVSIDLKRLHGPTRMRTRAWSGWWAPRIAWRAWKRPRSRRSYR
jgi:predicted permease